MEPKYIVITTFRNKELVVFLDRDTAKFNTTDDMKNAHLFSSAEAAITAAELMRIRYNFDACKIEAV